MRRGAATLTVVGLLAAAAGGGTAALAASAGGTGGSTTPDDTTTTGTTTTGTTTTGTTTTGTTTTPTTTGDTTPAPTRVTTTPQAANDAKGDVRSPLDLSRFAFARGSDGRLRATLTLASAWSGENLLSSSGLPGSICVKTWTTAAPPDSTPDYLVCTTAASDGTLRGSVLHERANKLPARTAGADVSRPSTRTVTLRFSQTAIGKPALVYVAAESTRPGCPRGSCIDLAPDPPAALAFRLRAATK